MIPGGRLVDKLGPRLVVTAGAFCVGAGMILSSMTLTVTGVTIGFGLLCGAAMGFGYAAPTPAAVKWFQPHKKGLIAGLVVAGFGGASIYTAPLTNYLLKAYGVNGAFYILGALFFVVMIVLGQYLS
ncbi:MAG: MFS transporter [Eubacteriales bacterium]